MAYARSGQITEALHLLDQVEVRQTTGGGGDRIMLHLGEGYLLAGRVEDAHPWQSVSWRSPVTARNAAIRHGPYGCLARSRCTAIPRTPPRLKHYRQALALAEELGMRPLQAHCHTGLGTLYTTTGRREQARTELAVAIALYRAMEMTFWPRTEAALAQVL